MTKKRFIAIATILAVSLALIGLLTWNTKVGVPAIKEPVQNQGGLGEFTEPVQSTISWENAFLQNISPD